MPDAAAEIGYRRADDISSGIEEGFGWTDLGLVVPWAAPLIVSSTTRLQGQAVWEMIAFLLQGIVFALIGLHCGRFWPICTAIRPPTSLATPAR